MRFLFFCTLLLFGLINTYGQDCNCPSNHITNAKGKANKIFNFKNGKKIGFCGSIDIEKHDTIYYDFNVFECGHDTIINEWEDENNYNIQFKSDTLIIKELCWLPIGTGLSDVLEPFFIKKYYYYKKSLKSKSYFRKDLPKYSIKETNLVIDHYNHLQIKGNYDSALRTANQLFWAYVSGSKKAEEYLITFENKFGPFDGAIKEEWGDIIATYELYKDRNK